MEKAKLLQISQLGHPILRKKTTEVAEITDFSDKELQELIDNMIATVGEVDGVGIAAPQVYESKQVFIMASNPSKRYPNAPKMKPTAILNPKIILRSEETNKDWEGCLSIPGIRSLVSRYTWVKVEYFTRDGKKQTKTFQDFVARIFQHEFDHLDGIVFLDRADSKEYVTEKEYRRILDLEDKAKEKKGKKK